MSDLAPGDQIHVGVTHEILISGERSWIKYEISTKVQPDEDEEDARNRASELVNKGVMRIITETVETVRLR